MVRSTLLPNTENTRMRPFRTHPRVCYLASPLLIQGTSLQQVEAFFFKDDPGTVAYIIDLLVFLVVLFVMLFVDLLFVRLCWSLLIVV